MWPRRLPFAPSGQLPDGEGKNTSLFACLTKFQGFNDTQEQYCSRKTNKSQPRRTRALDSQGCKQPPKTPRHLSWGCHLLRPLRELPPPAGAGPSPPRSAVCPSPLPAVPCGGMCGHSPRDQELILSEKASSQFCLLAVSTLLLCPHGRLPLAVRSLLRRSQHPGPHAQCQGVL